MLACAALTGIAADEESTDGLTAQQILDKMTTTYATGKSYRSSGVVTNDFGPHNETDRYPRHIEVKSFRTDSSCMANTALATNPPRVA